MPSPPIYSTLPAESILKKKDSIFNKDDWEDLTLWYLNAEQETILQLELALAKSDFNQLVILSDQIYGHGESFGFERISLLGKKIELAALEKNTILLTCLIASLKTYIKNLLRRIDVNLVM